MSPNPNVKSTLTADTTNSATMDSALTNATTYTANKDSNARPASALKSQSAETTSNAHQTRAVSRDNVLTSAKMSTADTDSTASQDSAFPTKSNVISQSPSFVVETDPLRNNAQSSITLWPLPQLSVV